MFERYTPAARRTIFFARHFALQAKAMEIGPTHFLLSVMYQAKSDAEALESAFKLRRRQEEVRSLVGFTVQIAKPDAKDIPLDKPAKRVLAFCAEEADAMDHYDIGPEHLILGMLREKNPACAVFDSLGIELSSFREWVKSSYAGRIGTGSPQPIFSISLIWTALVFVFSLGVIWIIWLVLRSW